MTTILKNITYFVKNRFIIFGLFFAAFVVVQYFFFNTFFPSAETKDIWFYSGVFMMLFSILFIEPYYTSPKNVITNAIPLLLVFLSIKSSFINLQFWWVAFIVLLTLIVASVIAMTLEDKDQSPEHGKNIVSNTIKNIVVMIGQGKILYSTVFIYFLLTYYSIQSPYTLTLFILWAVILCINPKSIHNNFSIALKRRDQGQIGNIFSVQSKKIFLVKLYDDRKNISKFDIVKFKHSMQTKDHVIMIGIVFDTYLLDQQKWVKILQLKEEHDEFYSLKNNVVYRVTADEEIKRISKNLKINDFSGIVIEGSTIGKIKFEYSKKNDDLQEGDLLELKVGKKRLFYQVINGCTVNEKIENKNEVGFIEGEATQLGEWQNEKISFQKFGWVPPINTPLFKADTSDITVGDFKYPDYKLGVIPGTLLPSVINLSEAASHHLALLGITGSGKSYLAQQIIRELLKDTRVICIDFTGEWKKNIDISQLESINKSNIETYLETCEEKIGIFELPALSNTTDVLKETQTTLENIFNYAKKKYDEAKPIKIVLVLEEAHTITPETSFLGDMGDFGGNKALVNKMTQIALQGRKYGVGLLVIAQRTANVSKTVLTQCNTVICFQAFDETSFSFLGNYVGKDMVQALPNIKQYHAIVAGKAVRSNMPMIIDLSR